VTVSSGPQEPEFDAAAHVVERTRAGADRESIVAELEQKGVDRGEAQQLVDTIHPHLKQQLAAERYESSALFPAVLGGLLAAVAGGLAWGLIVILTDYEIGIAAWGIGFLAGWLVVRFAGGRKGAPLQAVAIVSALLGIGIGKYVTFAYLWRKAAKAVGESVPSYVSSDVINAFFNNLDTVFGGFDILWAGLAVAAAWRIAKPLA
jgi:hypothetical protein